MSRVFIEFSDPESGVKNLSVTFDDLPPLSRDQRDAVWLAIGGVVKSFVTAPPITPLMSSRKDVS